MTDVLIVEDDAALCEALADTLELAGFKYDMASSGHEAMAKIARVKPLIVLTDIRMDGMDGLSLLQNIQERSPGTLVVVMTAYGSVEDAVKAMRFGAMDYLQKPFSAQALTEKLKTLLPSVKPNDMSAPVAHDAKSQALLSLALRVAHSDVGVMITGESGTGKEVLAHFIHDHSPRKAKPFIAINCAAIPEQMLEATLFGYEKGAYTGAYKTTAGKFEQAQEGTILLDEVSEMSLPLQAKLLRVLQEKEVERIGGAKLIKLDVRVIATSNRVLLDEVKAGRFREDLYYRLNVFPLHWLPLRERKSDIVPLAYYLIRRHCQIRGGAIPVLSPEAEHALLAYPWPGNARELDNVIQRALVLQTSNVIETRHLQLETQKILPVEEFLESPQAGSKKLRSHEFHIIEETLKECLGNRQKAAQTLGVSERTLRYKLAKMREEGFLV